MTNKKSSIKITSVERKKYPLTYELIKELEELLDDKEDYRLKGGI